MSTPLPRRPRRKLKYKVIIQDEGISVCEIKFNDDDFAALVGNIMSAFLGQIMAVDTDAMRQQFSGVEYPFGGYNETI